MNQGRRPDGGMYDEPSRLVPFSKAYSGDMRPFRFPRLGPGTSRHLVSFLLLVCGPPTTAHAFQKHPPSRSVCMSQRQQGTFSASTASQLARAPNCMIAHETGPQKYDYEPRVRPIASRPCRRLRSTLSWVPLVLMEVTQPGMSAAGDVASTWRQP